ncbi:hypothetical protein HO173_011900 [Letharia columbiana]|uniref:Uncharacterized protein n=1 Tax=Letharia columbiana TaxID=112416 RepID=A0A8H6CQN7_9LECA|nr:uncharacterized protein HO173_011900 [Letharia columbiana]KAF6227798.1 hypothetical protein HO173_011900 [Letharia columbiana]
MLEVVYFDLGTHYLQVVPMAGLVPVYNYKQVERLWGFGSFDLIDMGADGDFMAVPCLSKLEGGDRHLAKLHWDDKIPFHLKYERRFWVGPMDQYNALRQMKTLSSNNPARSGSSTAPRQLGSKTASAQTTSRTDPAQQVSSSDDEQHTPTTDEDYEEADSLSKWMQIVE